MFTEAIEAGHRALLAAIMAQAVRDAEQTEDAALQLDACLWLASEEAVLFADALNVHYSLPMEYLTKKTGNMDVKKLFEELTPEQAKELASRIVPLLQALRADIIAQSPAQDSGQKGTAKDAQNSRN